MKSLPSKGSGTKAIFWWVVWISLTIISFFIAAWIWTPIIARHFGSVRETHAAVYWVAAVFGTWMIILIPLIILMYSKVDKAYEDARIRKEQNANRFRSIQVDPEKRLLPEKIQKQLASWPPTIEGGHLVHVTLADGRTIENVFISQAKEVLGVYNAREFSFEGKDVTSVAAVDFSNPPVFLANLWLRLDGAASE